MLLDSYMFQPEHPRQQQEQRIECPSRPSALAFLEEVRERRQERDERKQERKAEKDKSRQERREAHRADKPAASIEDAGGIQKLVMPRGFVKEPGDPESFRAMQRFHLADAPGVRIGYEQCPYKPLEDVDRRLQQLLKEPPHRLSGREIEEIASTIPNALYGYNGDFTVVSMETARVNGKPVLIMQTSFNKEDRRTFGIFANANLGKETIDSVWFEAPNREYKQHSAEAMDALRSINWKDSGSGPIVNNVPFRCNLPVSVLK